MQFEALFQDLAHGAEIFRAILLGVTQAESRIRPEPESWSILEVLCHLYDIEREDFRPKLRIMLHRPGEKWTMIDPGSWVTSRGYNLRDLHETVEGFLEERQNSLKWLKSLKEPDWEAEYSDQNGVMKAGEMFSSWAAHDNLHMRQLVELKRHRLINLVKPYEVGYAGDW